MVESRQYRMEQTRAISCLRESFILFEAEYGPMLKDSVRKRKFWDGVRDRTIERGVVMSLGVAGLAGAAGLVMLGIKHLKSMLGIL